MSQDDAYFQYHQNDPPSLINVMRFEKNNWYLPNFRVYQPGTTAYTSDCRGDRGKRYHGRAIWNRRGPASKIWRQVDEKVRYFEQGLQLIRSWRYAVKEKLGWGAFSTVWSCKDSKMGFEVAVKVAKRNQSSTQGCISCGILVSGIRERGVSSEHMENMEMFSCSPT